MQISLSSTTSIPKKQLWAKVIIIIVLLAVVWFAYTQAIVAASWIAAFFVALGTAFCVALFTYFYPRTYTFDRLGITIADHRNTPLESIAANNIYGWNEYIWTNKGTKNYELVIDTTLGILDLSKDNYDNFEEMIRFFEESEYPKDKDLDIKNTFNMNFGRPNSTTERNILFAATGISILMLIVFGWICSYKVESKETLFLYSKVESISKPKKGGGGSLTLADYPSIKFQIDQNQIPFVNTKIDNKGEVVFENMGKKIKVGVSKSAYNWKVGNAFIRQIGRPIDPKLEIESYEILGDSLAKY